MSTPSPRIWQSASLKGGSSTRPNTSRASTGTSGSNNKGQNTSRSAHASRVLESDVLLTAADRELDAELAVPLDAINYVGNASHISQRRWYLASVENTANRGDERKGDASPGSKINRLVGTLPEVEVETLTATKGAIHTSTGAFVSVATMEEHFRVQHQLAKGTWQAKRAAALLSDQERRIEEVSAIIAKEKEAAPLLIAPAALPEREKPAAGTFTKRTKGATDSVIVNPQTLPSAVSGDNEGCISESREDPRCEPSMDDEEEGPAEDTVSTALVIVPSQHDAPRTPRWQEEGLVKGEQVKVSARIDAADRIKNPPTAYPLGPSFEMPPKPACLAEVAARYKDYEDTLLSFWGVWFVVAAAVRFKRPIRRKRRFYHEATVRQRQKRMDDATSAAIAYHKQVQEEVAQLHAAQIAKEAGGGGASVVDPSPPSFTASSIRNAGPKGVDFTVSSAMANFTSSSSSSSSPPLQKQSQHQNLSSFLLSSNPLLQYDFNLDPKKASSRALRDVVAESAHNVRTRQCLSMSAFRDGIVSKEQRMQKPSVNLRKTEPLRLRQIMSGVDGSARSSVLLNVKSRLAALKSPTHAAADETDDNNDDNADDDDGEEVDGFTRCDEERSNALLSDGQSARTPFRTVGEKSLMARPFSSPSALSAHASSSFQSYRHFRPHSGTTISNASTAVSAVAELARNKRAINSSFVSPTVAMATYNERITSTAPPLLPTAPRSSVAGANILPCSPRFQHHKQTITRAYRFLNQNHNSSDGRRGERVLINANSRACDADSDDETTMDATSIDNNGASDAVEKRGEGALLFSPIRPSTAVPSHNHNRSVEAEEKSVRGDHDATPPLATNRSSVLGDVLFGHSFCTPSSSVQPSTTSLSSKKARIVPSEPSPLPEEAEEMEEDTVFVHAQGSSLPEDPTVEMPSAKSAPPPRTAIDSSSRRQPSSTPSTASMPTPPPPSERPRKHPRPAATHLLHHFNTEEAQPTTPTTPSGVDGTPTTPSPTGARRQRGQLFADHLQSTSETAARRGKGEAKEGDGDDGDGLIFQVPATLRRSLAADYGHASPYTSPKALPSFGSSMESAVPSRRRTVHHHSQTRQGRMSLHLSPSSSVPSPIAGSASFRSENSNSKSASPFHAFASGSAVASTNGTVYGDDSDALMTPVDSRRRSRHGKGPMGKEEDAHKRPSASVISSSSEKSGFQQMAAGVRKKSAATYHVGVKGDKRGVENEQSKRKRSRGGSTAQPTSRSSSVASQVVAPPSPFAARASYLQQRRRQIRLAGSVVASGVDLSNQNVANGGVMSTPSMPHVLYEDELVVVPFPPPFQPNGKSDGSTSVDSVKRGGDNSQHQKSGGRRWTDGASSTPSPPPAFQSLFPLSVAGTPALAAKTEGRPLTGYNDTSPPLSPDSPRLAGVRQHPSAEWARHARKLADKALHQRLSKQLMDVTTVRAQMRPLRREFLLAELNDSGNHKAQNKSSSKLNSPHRSLEFSANGNATAKMALSSASLTNNKSQSSTSMVRDATSIHHTLAQILGRTDAFISKCKRNDDLNAVAKLRRDWFVCFYEEIVDRFAFTEALERILWHLQECVKSAGGDSPIGAAEIANLFDLTSDEDLSEVGVQFVLCHAAAAFSVQYNTFRELLEIRFIPYLLLGNGMFAQLAAE